MPLIPNNAGLVTVVYDCTDVVNPFTTSFGVDNQTGLNATDIAVDVGTIWAADVMPFLTSNVRMLYVEVVLDTQETAQASNVTAGGNNNAPAPPNVTYLVSKRSIVTGRRNRGRMYLPGVDETSINGAGVLALASQVDLAGLCQSLFDDLVTAELPMLILHETLPAIGTLVSELRGSSRVATQRRRLR